MDFRIRIEPGLDSFYLNVVNEGKIFTIIDGPIELNEYEWWLVESDEDAEITGWYAGEYFKNK